MNITEYTTEELLEELRNRDGIDFYDSYYEICGITYGEFANANPVILVNGDAFKDKF